ncbi:MAG: hypothetical protein ACI4P4_14325 [Faecousia sp.]
MNPFREKLVEKLGAFGFALWFIISLIYIILPVAILPIPFWLRGIIVLVIYALPMIGLLVQIGVFFWGFYVTISGPQDVVAIIFYIVFALWIISTFIPLLISVFSTKNSN